MRVCEDRRFECRKSGGTTLGGAGQLRKLAIKSISNNVDGNQRRSKAWEREKLMNRGGRTIHPGEDEGGDGFRPSNDTSLVAV